MRKIDNSLLQLYDAIGSNLEARIVRILSTDNKIASGNLVKSVEVITGSKKGEMFLELFMEKYWYFVNYGRKPGKMPPIDAIKKWVLLKGLPEGAAYPIAKKIALRGYKGIFFLEEAVKTIERDFEKEITEKWGNDLYEELYEQLTRTIRK